MCSCTYIRMQSAYLKLRTSLVRPGETTVRALRGTYYRTFRHPSKSKFINDTEDESQVIKLREDCVHWFLILCVNVKTSNHLWVALTTLLQQGWNLESTIDNHSINHRRNNSGIQDLRCSHCHDVLVQYNKIGFLSRRKRPNFVLGKRGIRCIKCHPFQRLLAR